MTNDQQRIIIKKMKAPSRQSDIPDIETYPIELLTPLEHMRLSIRISPFHPLLLKEFLEDGGKSDSKEDVLAPDYWLDVGQHLLYYKSGRSALKAALQQIISCPDDGVLIVTTSGGPYISSCVTKTIEEVCTWSRKLEYNTRAILVIHEFGFPCYVPPHLISSGLPIIEDCAYAAGTRQRGNYVGSIGDYAVYSLTKHYPVPFGGLVVSKKTLKHVANHETLSPSGIQLLKSLLVGSYSVTDTWNIQRRHNWDFFATLLKRYNIAPYFDQKEDNVPGVFLFKLPATLSGLKIKERCITAGIEATEYYGQDGFYFPVHQFLTDYEKMYILYCILQGQSI